MANRYLPLTREGAKLLQTRRQGAHLSFSEKPIESGMGGCPWRIAVAVIVRRLAAEIEARRVLALLLERWSTPEALASAQPIALTAILSTLNNYHRRARALLTLSKKWVGDDWATVLNLPYCGLAVADAIWQYARQSRPEAPAALLGLSPAAGPLGHDRAEPQTGEE